MPIAPGLRAGDLLCTPLAEVRVQETRDTMLVAKTADIEHMTAALSLNSCRLPAGHMPAETSDGAAKKQLD